MFLVQSSPLHGMASFARFKHWQDLPPFTFLIMLWAEPGGGRFEGFKTLRAEWKWARYIFISDPRFTREPPCCAWTRHERQWAEKPKGARRASLWYASMWVAISGSAHLGDLGFSRNPLQQQNAEDFGLRDIKLHKWYCRTSFYIVWHHVTIRVATGSMEATSLETYLRKVGHVEIQQELAYSAWQVLVPATGQSPLKSQSFPKPFVSEPCLVKSCKVHHRSDNIDRNGWHAGHDGSQIAV